MLIPRKYLTLYVVIGSILVFSLKDSLNLVHTLLHAIPNPLHSHAFALPPLPGEPLGHDERMPHTHQVAHHPHYSEGPATLLSHDVVEHLPHRNQQQVSQPASQSDKEESKQSAPFTWDIQALFSYQLFKPFQVQLSKLSFIPAGNLLSPFYPPSPPPEAA